jgi:hypothetical protein
MKAGCLTVLRHFPPDYQRHRLQSLHDQLTPLEKNLLETELISLVQLMPPKWPAVKKATALYCALARYLKYDHTACRNNNDRPYTEKQSFTYLGALFNGTAVCSGISQLYAVLCQCYGIYCQVVEGFGGSEEDLGCHAWVQIRLPNTKGILRSYHCDLTWDLHKNKSPHQLRYFLKSDDYFESHNHHWFHAIGEDFGWHKFDPCPEDYANIPNIPENVLNQIESQLRAFRMPQRYIMK